MQRSIVVASVSLPLHASAQNSGVRIGVLSIGPTQKIGRARAMIEARLTETEGVTLAKTSELAQALAAKAPMPTIPEMPAATAAEADVLLKAIQSAYFGDQPAEAFTHLNALARLYEGAKHVPATRAAVVHLWRATLLLANKDNAQAEKEALAALESFPGLVVDLNVMPPAVEQMVAQVRGFQLQTTDVQLRGVPKGAHVVVDGVRVKRTFTVSRGTHRVQVAAAGYHLYENPLQAFRSQQTLPIRLVPAVDKDRLTQLSGALWAETMKAADVTTGSQLVTDLGLDGLCIVGYRSEPPGARGIVFWRDAQPQRGPEVELNDIGFGLLANWAANAVTQPRVATQGTSSAAWVLNTDLQLGAGLRTHTVSLPTEDVEFIVGGPSVRGQFWISRSLFAATAQIGFASYAPSTVAVTLPGIAGGANETSGGSAFEALVAVGAQHRFVYPEIAVQGLVGFFHEARIIADELESGLIANYSRRGARLIGRGVWLPRSTDALSASIAIDPASTWQQDNSEALGTAPQPGLGVGAQGNYLHAINAQWTGGIGYSLSAHSVSFSGPGSIDVDPPATDVTISELTHNFMLTFSRSL